MALNQSDRYTQVFCLLIFFCGSPAIDRRELAICCGGEALHVIGEALEAVGLEVVPVKIKRKDACELVIDKVTVWSCSLNLFQAVQRKRNDPMVVAAVNACLSAKGTVKDKAVSAKGTVKN